MIVLILCGLFAFLVLHELYYEYKVRYFGRKIPGPPIYPIIGNAHLLLGCPASFRDAIHRLTNEYGSRYRIMLGPELFVFLSNPKDVEQIVSSNVFINKSEDYNALKPWLGEGLLTASGQNWKRQRKFITPSFHFNILQNFLPIFEKNGKILVQKLEQFADGTQIVDIFPHVGLCALDSMCESAMGVSIEAQTRSESDYVKAVSEMTNIANYRMRHVLLRRNLFFQMSTTKFRQKKALEVLHKFTEGVIRNRRKLLQNELVKESKTSKLNDDDVGLKKRINFLDLIITSELEDGRKLTDLEVREEVDTFMFEGHDTTTSAISFCLYLLSKHEEIQTKLFEEQRSIFKMDLKREANFSDLAEMKYLESTIKESLRIYPSVPFIARRITENTCINGMQLPKDSTVVIDVLHLHRNEASFNEPLKFAPERFLSDNISSRNAFSWTPFSAGQRNCIGQKFAMLEMKSTLSQIIRKFKIHQSGTEPEISLNLILRPDNGLKVILEKRY